MKDKTLLLIPLVISLCAARPAFAGMPLFPLPTVAPSHASLKPLRLTPLRLTLEMRRADVVPMFRSRHGQVVLVNQQIRAVEAQETSAQVRADRQAVIGCLRHELSLAQQRLVLDQVRMTQKNPQVIRLRQRVTYLRGRICQMS